MLPSLHLEERTAFVNIALRRKQRQNVYAFAVSAIAHALALGAALQFSSARPLSPVRLRVIEVELVAEKEAVSPAPHAETTDVIDAGQAVSAPEAMVTAPSSLPAVEPKPVAVSEPSTPAVEPAVGKANEGYVVAEDFYAAAILNEPGSEQVRETLPLLAAEERVTQLCNIEALEQVRRNGADVEPDSLDPSSFGPTSFSEGRLSAPDGAIRMKRTWYHIDFQCVPGDDLESVKEFRFRLGEEIPRDQWDEHNLLPEDFDDD